MLKPIAIISGDELGEIIVATMSMWSDVTEIRFVAVKVVERPIGSLEPSSSTKYEV